MNRDRWKGLAWMMRVTTVYALIAVVVTWPVAAKFSSAVGGYEGQDAFEYAWVLCWFKISLLEMHTSPADLRVLYAPGGVYHPFMLTTPYLGLVSLPLSLFLNPLAVYNLQLLLAFVLTGLSAYLLCYELGGNRVAAFVGGLVFAFFPNRMGHALAGHLTQLTAYWPPLGALFLLRTFRQSSVKYGLLTGVCLALSALTNLMHGAYFAVMLMLGITLWQGIELKRAAFTRQRGLALGAGLVVAGLIALPFFAPLFFAGGQGGLDYLSAAGTVEHSTDLLAFVLPSPYHPLLSRWGLVPEMAKAVLPDQRSLEEGLAYLGVVPLVLAGLGAIRHWRKVQVWVILGAVAALLSLGPFLTVGGRVLQVRVDNWRSYLPLPYLLVKQLPFYQWGRTPDRMNDVLGLSLAVLVTFGVVEAHARLKSRWVRVLAVAMMCVVTLVEYNVMFPFPLGGERVPTYYHQMAAEGGDYTVLDIPGVAGHATDTVMYYQMYHQHPIVGGHMTRHPPGAFERADFISNLAQPSPSRDIISHPSAQERRAWLARAGIGRVIVHKDLMIAVQREAVIAFLRDLLGEPVFEDEQIVAFAVPPLDEPGEERLFALSSQGWHQPERWGGFPARWLRERGALYVWQSTGETAQLRFMTYAFQQPQVVEVTVNDQPVGAVLAHADWPEYVTSDFVLRPGLNVIRFTLPDGCADFIGDPRCLVRQRFAARFGQELECDESQRAPRCLGALIGRVELVSGESVFPERPLDANIGNHVRLLGWDSPADPVKSGESLPVTLYWQGLSLMREDYTVFVHLTDAAGQVVAQHDGYPLGGSYPTSSWPVNVTVADRVEIPLPPDLPPGEYTLKAGMYLLSTLERLPVAGDAMGENAVVLGTVTVK